VQTYCFGSIKAKKNNTDPTKKCHIYQNNDANIQNYGSLTKVGTNTCIRDRKRSRQQFEEYDAFIMQKRSQT
jgi:hypothetical protein